MPCQGISIGNLWQRPLADILSSYEPASLPVVRQIAAGGPWELAHAAGLEPARPLYADECHLCYELRCRLRVAGRHCGDLHGGKDLRGGDHRPRGDAGRAEDADAQGFHRRETRAAGHRPPGCLAWGRRPMP